jgi:hypothetical protein
MCAPAETVKPLVPAATPKRSHISNAPSMETNVWQRALPATRPAKPRAESTTCAERKTLPMPTAAVAPPRRRHRRRLHQARATLARVALAIPRATRARRLLVRTARAREAVTGPAPSRHPRPLVHLGPRTTGARAAAVARRPWIMLAAMAWPWSSLDSLRASPWSCRLGVKRVVSSGYPRHDGPVVI